MYEKGPQERNCLPPNSAKIEKLLPDWGEKNNCNLESIMPRREKRLVPDVMINTPPIPPSMIVMKALPFAHSS